MAKPRNDLLDRLTYLALRLVAMILHCFPVNANLRTAMLLGDILYYVDRKHRERALHNLKRCFPELSDARHREIARKSCRHLIMLAVEVLFSTRLIHLNSWTRYVELAHLQETIALMTRKQGLIMLTGHYGNWEVLGYVLATLGFGTTTIARPLDNPYVSEFVFAVREKNGQKIITKTGATSEVTQTLDQKGTVCFTADQNAGSKGIFVDFFGRQASTYKSIGLLAMQYDVPVVIGYARRINDQFRFKIGVQDIIYPEDWKKPDIEDPLRYITQRYSKAIENFVRDDPTQYLWIHRRWKTRPKGEAPEAFD